jgi:hypothetical protein
MTDGDTSAPIAVVPSFVDALIKTYAQKALTAAAATVGFTGVQQGQIAQIGVGVILGLVSIAWAYLEERLARARLIAAVVSPAATPVVQGFLTPAVKPLSPPVA